MRRLFRRDEERATAPPPDEAWTVAQGEHDGQPLILRFNEGAAGADRAAWPFRLGIAVPLLEPNDAGLPGDADHGPLGDVEEALAAQAERLRAVFTLVATTGGMREFVVYLPDEDAAAPIVEAARAAAPTHEVQHYVERDPDWMLYEEFRP